MKLRFFFSAFCLLFFGYVVFEVAACKDTTDSTVNVQFPTSGPVAYSLVDQLFQQRCATSGCHNSGTKAGNLDLTSPSYSALVNYPTQLIVPKNGSQSRLYLYLTGGFQPQMPPSGAVQLTQNQIAGIKLWIDDGALYP